MDKLLNTIVTAIQDKKGDNIISYDLSAFDGAVASKFVICNADSTAQVEAIANGIEEVVLEKMKEKPYRIEGITNAIWVVIDYVDIMVHVFLTEARDFYKLDQLWADAPVVKHDYKK